jgi:hypothetical protein
MQKMRASQIHPTLEMAAFQLDFARDFDVSEVEPISDDGIPEPEAAVVDVVEIFGQQPFDKGSSNDAVRGRRGISCEVDEAAIGDTFDDEFFRDAFGLEVWGVGENASGE